MSARCVGWTSPIFSWTPFRKLKTSPLQSVGFATSAVMSMKEKRCRPIPNIVTAPFPGFSTDLQSALMAVLSTADGISFVEEKIFEARFQIVPELVKMGASIVNQDSFALIEGVRRLSGAKVQARELRGGAGLIMAALAAEGETVKEGMEYVRRGYEDIKGDLKSLGIVIY